MGSESLEELYFIFGTLTKSAKKFQISKTIDQLLKVISLKHVFFFFFNLSRPFFQADDDL